VQAGLEDQRTEQTEPLQITVTASIGIATTTDPHHPAEQLLHDADKIMYQAKIIQAQTHRPINASPGRDAADRCQYNVTVDPPPPSAAASQVVACRPDRRTVGDASRAL